MSSIVALLSDFGLSDHYVGVMKAEIIKRAPDARLIDLTHGITPQSIRQASFYLKQAVASFPVDTIFLCVVDPGVGSSRRAVAVRTGELRFVAPDNGLLNDTLELLGGAKEIVQLPLPQGSSNTFHGRDVFAPAAGLLAAGKTLGQIGMECASLVRLPRLTRLVQETHLKVSVLFADHFGNLCFDFTRTDGWSPLRVGADFCINSKNVVFANTFSEVEPGESLLLWNSSGYLELAVRNGNARGVWGFTDGNIVEIEISSVRS